MMIKHNSEPLIFNGKNKKSKYFEGWYFKQVSADLKNIISVIPGISYSGNDSHSFIQTIINRDIDGKQVLTTHYHRFPTTDFIYTDEPFSLEIGKNIFRKDGIELDLLDDEYTLQGVIEFSKFTSIERNILSPNAMGYFAHLPLMECYHDIISMDHRLDGSLLLNNKLIDFNGGKGYIEKDWGTSFPKEYIWLQSNHFKGSDASIMCSIANIPFIGTSFKGFICNLTVNGQEYRFASYNNSKVLEANYTDNTLDILLAKSNLKLKITAKIIDGGELKAPKNGIMDIVIKEGLCGVLDVKLTRSPGEVIFEGNGNPCAIEIVNSNTV